MTYKIISVIVYIITFIFLYPSNFLKQYPYPFVNLDLYNIRLPQHLSLSPNLPYLSFLKIITYLFIISYFYVFVSVRLFTPCGGSQTAEEGVGSPWNWSYRRLRAPMWCWKLNPGSLQESWVPWTAEPPLQPSIVYLWQVVYLRWHCLFFSSSSFS